MAHRNHAPEITELDRLLLRERGWSFSETQENILAACEPRAPGKARIVAARCLRAIADWADAAERPARSVSNRSA